MESFLADGTHLSSFGLIDLAIRESYVDFLFDCLLEALNNSQDELNIEPRPTKLPLYTEAFQFRVTLIKELCNAIKNDEEGSFVESYCKLVAESELDLVKNITPSLLSCEIGPILSALDLNKKELPRFDDSKALQIYRAKPYQPYKSFSKQSLLLTPFYYLMHLPFWPPNNAKLIRPLILNNLSHERYTIASLATKLSETGVFVRMSFLRFILLNEDQVIFTDANKDTYLPINYVIRDFDLCARLINRKEYASWEIDNLYSIDNMEEEYFTEITNFKIYPDKVKTLLSHRISPGYIDELDWLEVSAKMLSRYDESEVVIQGFPAALHKALVEILVTHGRALKKSDFEIAIGFKIQIEPDLLPPGRIMAYKAHNRFQNPDEAYYVLKDWVESDTEKRGKISRNRIATPFVDKDYSFTHSDLMYVINADDLYLQFGIVDIDKVAFDLIMDLPSRPFESYYVRKIKENINSMLKNEMIYLGLDYFIRKELCLDRKAGEAIDSWRVRIISSLMKATFNLKEKIGSIENATVKTSLLKMIR